MVYLKQVRNSGFASSIVSSGVVKLGESEMKCKIRLVIMLIVMLMMTALVACDRDNEPEEGATTSTESFAVSNYTKKSTDFPSPQEILELVSEARYVFEQMFFPAVVYNSDEEEVIDLMNTLDELGMERLVLESWESVADAFIGFSIVEGILSNPIPRDVLGLGDEHILEVTAESLTEDVSAFIISMLDIEQSLRSTYIAIVYYNNELQIYTLEQSEGFHMLCFVDMYYRGSLFEVENDRDAFLEAIIYVLAEDEDEEEND